MKTALLILNFGGPQNEAEVEPFLYQLFRDKDVIPLPGGMAVQELFARFVSRRRAPKTAAQYALIGGGSPLVETTYRQAEALSALLAQEGLDLSVHVGMRYTAPFIGDALAGIKASGAERVLCLALYPHESFATTASTYNEVKRAALRLGLDEAMLTFVPAWHDDADYLEAMAERIRESLAQVPSEATPHLLFSAHGLPESFIRRGDPYLGQIQATVRDVVAQLAWEGPHSLAFQSRVGPAKWLSPYTDDELKRLSAGGAESVVVVPLSFVGEHIETLFELDQAYRQVALEAGLRHYVRVPALDTHPRFIAALANQVKAAMAQAPGEFAPG